MAACGSRVARADDATTRPNVIIIFADDLGNGDLACYGHEKFKTPNLDRMAREGVRLTNFYSCCPYCAPSRAGLLTGRYQLRSGMTRNPTPDRGINDVGLPDREITLAEAFAQAGYRTCHLGKWHLGHRPEFMPRTQGFHEYFGILYSNDMHPVELFDNETMVEYPVFQPTLTRRYTERAVSFIKRNVDRPFFLYLAHAMPHKPLAASEAFYTTSGAGLYGDVIAELDWGVGRVLETIREAGIDERTIVFFTSDNGPWYGGSTGGLRGMKGLTWEGGIRVPMIARSPGRIPASKVCNEPAITLDLFTTSLKLAGLTPPADRIIDGKDITGLLTDENAKSPHDALFSVRGDQICSVRSGNWKLHLVHPGGPLERRWSPEEEWIDPRRPDGVRIIAQFEQSHPSEYPGVWGGDEARKIGLFDLATDPGEQHNLADKHPDVVRRLGGLLDRFKQSLAQEQHAAGH